LAELIDNFCEPVSDFASQFMCIANGPRRTKATSQICHLNTFVLTFICQKAFPICPGIAQLRNPRTWRSFNELANGIGNP